VIISDRLAELDPRAAAVMLAGAHGGAAWRAHGEQFRRYEAAIGTGQAIFWFAP
jgi:hypothetical protein